MDINLQRELVFKLKEETTFNLLQCKAVLEKVGWDYEKALNYIYEHPWEVMSIGYRIIERYR